MGNPKMDSRVVTINALLRLEFDAAFSSFIAPSKDIMEIPVYQREYKWKKEKIKTFVDNVMKRSKFLGIITAEVLTTNRLSLVDGQQRLTTIMLMLAQLYNRCGEEGETETQKEIKGLMTCVLNGDVYFRLENESVGPYLEFCKDEEQRDKIELKIDSEKDVYKQRIKFEEAWTIVGHEIDAIRKTEGKTLEEYKQQLLDCKVLLFVHKNENQEQQGSIEEIYIDINEKAQQLEPEDIFKGYCFAICKTEGQQLTVKNLWHSIKKNFFAMDSIFVKSSMGVFLHQYFLMLEAREKPRQNIKMDLTIDGDSIVYLRYNTPTKVKTLLTDIEKYQNTLMEFRGKLGREDYYFDNVMVNDAQIIGNKKKELRELRTILKDIFDCTQNLFKLPLFFIINQNVEKPEEQKLTYAQWSVFLYLYYVYMFLFSRLSGSKKREDLASDLILKISKNEDFLIQFIREIKDYEQELSVDEKKLQNQDVRKHLYAIIDYLKIQAKKKPVEHDADVVVSLHLFPDNYNIEHLIVNKSHKVEWRSSGYSEESPVPNTEYKFIASDFSGCQAWSGPNNRWPNFIWIDEDFNRENLGNKDIINKILLIRGNCDPAVPAARGSYADRHRHIEMICQQIMKTEGFVGLKDAYDTNAAREEVLEKYKIFVNNYFSEESTNSLCVEINGVYKCKLQELYDLL